MSKDTVDTAGHTAGDDPFAVTAGTIPLFIDGEEVSSDTSDVVDPARPDSIVGRIGQTDGAGVHRALDAAENAWSDWAALRPTERAQMLTDALDGLSDVLEDHARILSRENGKVVAEARIELGVFETRCRLAASYAAEMEKVDGFLPEHETDVAPRRPIPFKSEVRRLPMGVVSIITPYNWPVAILAASLPFALVAGNTVVVKPPASNPLATVLCVTHLAKRLPKGVLNVVLADHDDLEPMITDPRVRSLTFTGSTGAGQKMSELTAGNLAKTTLELGGNDPALVLEDAVLDAAAIERMALAGFMTTGQVCMGLKRVYVHRSRYAELVEKLTAFLQDWKIGHGLEDDVQMGPLHNAKQRDFVAELLAEARDAGTEVRELGTLSATAQDGDGYFLRPALVLDPDPSLRIVTEEQFGPALPILPFDDLDATIAALNDEWAGLCSSVWSGDPDRAVEVARRMRTGTVWIDNHNAVAQDDRVPFGGFRMSGVGRELGVEGLIEFTEPQSVTWSVL